MVFCILTESKKRRKIIMLNCNPLLGNVTYQDLKNMTCQNKLERLASYYHPGIAQPYSSYSQEQKNALLRNLEKDYSPAENKNINPADVPCFTDALEELRRCFEETKMEEEEVAIHKRPRNKSVSTIRQRI